MVLHLLLLLIVLFYLFIQNYAVGTRDFEKNIPIQFGNIPTDVEF